MKKKLILVFALLLGLEAGAVPRNEEPQPAPTSTIDLGVLQYLGPQPVKPTNKQAFHDLGSLMQDERVRLSFVDPDILALYFNRPADKAESGGSASLNRRMDVFFFNPESGKLVEHRTWATLGRQWFNDSYDTEGTIIAVHPGFLVHANGKLELYSPDLRLVRSYDLRGGAFGAEGMWSVAVAPGGNTIHVQPSAQINQVKHGSASYFAGGAEVEGTWLRSESFEKIGSQLYLGGPDSISNDAIVTKRIRCLDLQRLGEPPRHLSCSKPAAGGLPTFLNDHEVLSVHYAGFSVLSTQGAEIWTVGAPDPGIRRILAIGSHQRSMDGSRFAVSVAAYEMGVEFDGIPIARSPLNSIVVYDELCKRHILSVTAPTVASNSIFALSPDGRALATLSGTAINIYKVPEANCK